MHISLASLTSLLLYSGFSFSDIVPQVPLTYGLNTEPIYGYAGPGVYRIVSYSNNYAVSLNTSESTTGLVTMPPVTDDNDQRWLIAEVSQTEKMIINNGTGAILCAIKGSYFTRAASTPPYDPKARWTIDYDRYIDYPGFPVMLNNIGKKNTALDLSNSRKKAGTPVLSYPINNPKTKNQAWLLEYLEGPQPAPPSPPPPVPAPPEPTSPPRDPCEDFPEADQKALRGNVVEECNKWRFSNTITHSAQECYDVMKEDIETYGVLSYVFTSFAEPGSPDGQGGWGDCTGYQARSYRFFVGKSTGSSFGGDLALPYE